jgi:hypothetical protein
MNNTINKLDKLNFYNDKLYNKIILKDYKNFIRRVEILSNNYNLEINPLNDDTFQNFSIDIISLFNLDFKFIFKNKKTGRKFYFHVSLYRDDRINYKNNFKFNSIDGLFDKIESNLEKEGFNTKKQIILEKYYINKFNLENDTIINFHIGNNEQ